jgi:hypothetical protein
MGMTEKTIGVHQRSSAVGFFARIRQAWNTLVSGDTAIAKAKETLAPTLFANLMAGDAEDPTFRRLTSPHTIRDLNPVMQQRMQQIAFYVRATTPFGKRIVEVISDYVVGEGFTPAAKDPRVQQVVDRFWNDEVNNMRRQLRDWCDELTTFGELSIPAVVNPVDGFVRLGYLDPQMLDAVEYGTLSTGNDVLEMTTFPIALRMRSTPQESESRRLTLIRTEEDPLSSDFGQLCGQCFYWAINKAKGASRGLSELFALTDWIDVFDQMIFDYADKVRFLNAFVWDYTVKGAGAEEVEKWKKELTKNPRRQGGVQVHNDQVEIKAQTPTLQGADMSEAIRTVKLYGLGGVGLPAWFFADPIDANRSTADEMTGPTGKKLTERQNQLKAAVLQVLNFVVQQAIYKGVLPQGIDTTIALQVPDLMIKDLERAAVTLGAVTTALSTGQENGWIQSETAARGFHVVLSQIGVEVNSKDEFQLAQEEKKQRDQEHAQLMPRQASQADPTKQLQGGDQGGDGRRVQ